MPHHRDRAGTGSLHYVDEGQGVPVVLVHGNWTTSLFWKPVASLLLSLSSEPHRVIAPDLRGRGKSRALDGDYSVPKLAEDLALLLDHLGLSSAHLVGHSLGTAVVLELALAQRERARSLTLVGPAWPEGMPRAYALPERQRMAHENKAAFAAAFRAISPTAPDDAFYRELMDESHGQLLEASLGTLEALCSWAPGEKLRALRGLPSLVVSGALDMLSTVDVGRRNAELIGARHEILPGVGHSPNLEAPEKLVALWREFVREHATSR